MGFNASVLENPGIAEKLLQVLVLPADQEAMERLDLDQAVTRFFHSISQVITYYQINLILLCLCSFDKFCFLMVVVIGSSLDGRSREMRDVTMIEQDNARSIQNEMV